MSSNLTRSNSSFSSAPHFQVQDQDDDWFLIRLMTAFINAIWEQREKSESNAGHQERFTGIVTYCFSIYGVSCLVMALILNRTLVMASTNTSHNQRLAIGRNRGLISTPKSAEVLKRLSILSFRVGVIALLLYNAYNVLVALRLFSYISIAGNHVPWFYSLIPNRFFEYDPEYFISNRYMSTPKTQVMIGPTTDIYWPIFLNFCLSSFIETFVSVIQGKKPYTECGITIFEHSLAFQEVSSRSSFLFGTSRTPNRPTEQVLVACLFSILNHLNIHIGGLINNNKYRLIPSSLIGIGFLSYFISSIVQGKLGNFPTILILTLTPQVLILIIIGISLSIFTLAIIANGFGLQDLNYASFFLYENNENDNGFRARNLNFNLNDDFYTALLNLGVMVITSAGKSSYITELSLVTIDDETWLERSLWEKIKSKFNSSNIKEPVKAAKILEYLKENKVSGYSNLISQPSKRLISGDPNSSSDDDLNDSIYNNMSVFRKRYLYVHAMLVNLYQLLYGLIVNKFILNYVPSLFKRYILRQAVDQKETEEETMEEFENRKKRIPYFLRSFLKRTVTTPTKYEETDKHLINLDEYSVSQLENEYLYLLKNGEFSEIDNSQDYQITYDSESEIDDESDIESIDANRSIGARGPAIISNVSPINELITPEDFNALVNSSNITILQQHLNYDYENSGMMTRSKFNSLINSNSLSTAPTTNKDHQDETIKLLELILAKRSTKPAQKSCEDELSSRLECVICQTNMREIITWPCKCFAICESCRLSLVSKGIEGCVCCRRDVEGVSKVFIP